MGINLKHHNEKWRIEINEVWEFTSHEDFTGTLDKLIYMKDTFGKLPKEVRK